MEEAPGRCADELIRQAQGTFSNLRILRREISEQRWRVDLTGDYGEYTVRISEIISTTWRKYAYYVFRGTRIIVGFDNTPDPYALELKYPESAGQHRYERIPHRHGKDKKELALTDEMTLEDFIAWIRDHLEG